MLRGNGVHLSAIVFNDYIEPERLPDKPITYVPLGLSDLAAVGDIEIIQRNKSGPCVGMQTAYPATLVSQQDTEYPLLSGFDLRRYDRARSSCLLSGSDASYNFCAFRES